MEVYKNLSDFFDNTDVKQTELAELLGIQPSAISNAKNNRIPTPKKWIRIIKKHYNVLIDPNYNPIVSHNILAEAGTSYTSSFPTGDVQEATIERVLAHLQTKGEIKDFKVIGDSMNPTFIDGDYVRAVKVGVGQIINNYVYVVVYNNNSSIRIKRVHNRISDQNHLILRSDNEEHDQAIHVNPEQINGIYQVLCKLSFNLRKVSNFEERLINVEMELEEIRSKIE